MYIKTIRNSVYKNYEYICTDAGAAFIFNPSVNKETDEQEKATEAASVICAEALSTPSITEDNESMKDYSPALRRFVKRCKESASEEFDMFTCENLYDDFN